MLTSRTRCGIQFNFLLDPGSEAGVTMLQGYAE